MSNSKKNFGGIRHHYWEWPIATYLFLGGLGGGIFCLTGILSLIMNPGQAIVQEVLAWPCLLAIACLAFGCFLLVFELGQPLVFIRAFIKSTSILCWGARLLTVCMIFGIFWFCAFIPWEWFSPLASFFYVIKDFCLAIASLAGTCVVLYTGIFLSSLKAHSFWATPALPVLFTVSALSTACALISLSAGFWPAGIDIPTIQEVNSGDVSLIQFNAYALYATAMEMVPSFVHMLDEVIVVIELVVILVMVLSFLGAGNLTANKVANKWVRGSWAAIFWVGMIGCGLVLPEILYICFAHTGASEVVAPILVLAGGLLLRFMVVYSDERKPLPGEATYYGRLVGNDAEFIHRWKYGENEF